MDTKICKTKRDEIVACGLEKPKDDFYKGSALCKECFKQLNKLNSEYFKEYREKNKEKYNEYSRLKSKEYREKNKEYFQKYREKNKEMINKKSREHYINNVDKIKQKNKNWRENNPEKHREYNRISAAKSRKEQPEKHRWRGILKETLKKLNKEKNDKAIKLLGYSPKELKEFLLSLSPKWFEFEIDHKIPLTWFVSETPISLVNDFRNLQLLTKSENNKKRNFYMSDVDDDYLKEVKIYIKKEYLK